MPVNQIRSEVFRPTPESVAAVREFVREVIADEFDPDAASIVASELATNAVRHANTDFEVRVSRIGRRTRVEVINDAPEMIAAIREPSGETGRGLHIVDALATRWGAAVRDRGKVVWFELEAR